MPLIKYTVDNVKDTKRQNANQALDVFLIMFENQYGHEAPRAVRKAFMNGFGTGWRRSKHHSSKQKEGWKDEYK